MEQSGDFFIDLTNSSDDEDDAVVRESHSHGHHAKSPFGQLLASQLRTVKEEPLQQNIASGAVANAAAELWTAQQINSALQEPSVIADSVADLADEAALVQPAGDAESPPQKARAVESKSRALPTAPEAAAAASLQNASAIRVTDSEATVMDCPAGVAGQCRGAAAGAASDDISEATSAAAAADCRRRNAPRRGRPQQGALSMKILEEHGCAHLHSMPSSPQ
jgi:hypothetical protein